MNSWKRNIFKALTYFPIRFLFRPRFGGLGSILFMHKVVDNKGSKPRISLMEANEIEVGFLERMVVHLKDKGYEFISLKELTHRLTSGISNKRKFVVVTFDDGYRDNLTLAYPVFKKYNIPFTIYVTNSYPNRTANLWWYMLEDILLENDTVEVLAVDGNRRYTTGTQKEKDNAFMKIRSVLISTSPAELAKMLEHLETTYGKTRTHYVERETLHWDEVSQLAQDSLVTIGGHSMNHPAFNTLEEEQVHKEVMGSKLEIELHTGIELSHFAYPFGTANEINEREINLLKACPGITTATTTRMGNIFADHANYLHALPRIQVLGSQQDLGILELYLSGVIPAIKNRFKKVVTL